MKKVLLFVSLLIGSVLFGQTISINGSLHSTNGDNTFPIWVEEGTTIQPNYPVKSISIKEFNVVPNSNGNDLIFNKTVLVYSDSVSTVPEGKTWKLESIQNQIKVGDHAYGGIIIKINDDGSGKVITPVIAKMGYSDAASFCLNYEFSSYNDWTLISNTDYDDIEIYYNDFSNIYPDDYGSDQTRYWSSNNCYVWLNDYGFFESHSNTSGSHLVICKREF